MMMMMMTVTLLILYLRECFPWLQVRTISSTTTVTMPTQKAITKYTANSASRWGSLRPRIMLATATEINQKNVKTFWKIDENYKVSWVIVNGTGIMSSEKAGPYSPQTCFTSVQGCTQAEKWSICASTIREAYSHLKLLGSTIHRVD